MEEICKAIWSSPLPLQVHLLQKFLSSLVWIWFDSKTGSLQYSALEDYSTAPSLSPFLLPLKADQSVTSDNPLTSMIYLWFYIF